MWNVIYFVIKRLTNILFLLLLCSLKALAQYDVQQSHYFFLEPSFNAAAVGKEAKLNITGDYAHQLAGFENNSRTMYVAADMPFYAVKSYHGVGLQLMNDKIGLFKHQRLAAQYAYKHKLLGGTLSWGVQLGLLFEGFDGSKLDLEQSNDPAFPTSDVNGHGLDIGAGIYYMRGRWYLGLSAQHLNAPLINWDDRNELQIDRTYYLTSGCNIKLRNPFLTIQPSLLVRTDGTAYRADITGRLVYRHDNKLLYGGLGYSPTNSVTAYIGGKFRGIMLGYSYEAYTNGMSLGNGSHELFVGYQTDINLVKKGKNKHKSVRIL
ncbi:MAG: type IX secretion system membrane protein PorP/SprF [Prevotellaceae bacterium]|nr:type IX secretion system membrane protein PorP/SprF [Prevotellaceae bacterium]MDY3364716.1 type IX secretion system membrane protein PorP/SprF [Prevotella sp.]